MSRDAADLIQGAAALVKGKKTDIIWAITRTAGLRESSVYKSAPACEALALLDISCQRLHGRSLGACSNDLSKDEALTVMRHAWARCNKDGRDEDQGGTAMHTPEQHAASRAQKRKHLAEADPAGWTQHTAYHWSRYVNGKKLDYWPSRRKFQYDGKVVSGDVTAFLRAEGAK